MKKQWKIYLIPLLILVIIIVVLVLRSVTKESPKQEESAPILTDQQIINKIKARGVKKGTDGYWTTDCLTYDITRPGGKIIVEVREKHLDNAECPGDKNTAPLLRLYEVDGRTGRVDELQP